MLITYAGRLPGAPDFPPENTSWVEEQVGLIVAGLRPRTVVGSAAAGADLLVLSAALQAGAEAKVILAGSAAQFRASSVAGRGARWEQLYDALLRDARVEIIELERGRDDSSSYQAVTKVIGVAAERESGDERIVALTVSNRREGEDHSAELAATHELRGRLVLHIDPTCARDNAPAAFVAMPYGRRRGGGSTVEYEADATYQRILIPALIDAGYLPVRADTEALLEVIDITMLHSIHSARLLIADLATLNPNVMWELGVRHAWRRAGTILLRPAGTTSPFDVSHARVHQYCRDADDVSDEDAVAGIRKLRELIAAVAEERVDSPVFATIPDLDEPRLPELRASGAQEAAERYAGALSTQASLRDVDALQTLVNEIGSDGRLGDGARGALLEQAGLALIAAGEYGLAATVLAPLAERDSSMERTRLQQQYAHALIRSEAASGRPQRLVLAERRLQALSRLQPSGETYGLLASAAKARVEDAINTGKPTGGQLAVAIDSYLRGFRLDPGDYYPGIVAVALLRLRGQHLQPNEADLARSRELLPVVRFAAMREGELDASDVWRLATAAEIALHEHLLGCGEAQRRVAEELYEQVALRAGAHQRASVTRQLQMLLNAGDPAAVIDPILAYFDAAC